MTTSYNEPTMSGRQSLPPGENMARKRLYRSDSDKILAGVAGGMGEYFNMDPTIVRLLWVLVTIVTGGAAFWLYLALWLFLPVGDNVRGQMADPAIKLDEQSKRLAAWILIALGILWLLANVGALPMIWRGFYSVFRLVSMVFWPLLLIAGGWLLLSKVGGTGAFSQQVKSKIPEGESVKESVKQGYQKMRKKAPLKRSREDRVLLGVCAGIAHWLGIDPIIVRILWALFSLGSLGTGVLLYVFFAIIMPADDDRAIETVEGEVLDPVNVDQTQ